MKRKWIIPGLAAIVAGFVIFEMISPAGMGELPDGFKRVAFVRNENNEGIIRLYYALTVYDPATAAYEEAGNSLPYNRHSGVTTAFFFDEKRPVPDKLQLESPHFDTTLYRPVAVYTRGRDGAVILSKPE